MRTSVRVAIRVTVALAIVGGASRAWAASTWVIQTSKNPSSTNNFFRGVTTTSATNAWAVGSYQASGLYKTLIEHYNGTGWSKQTSFSFNSVDNYFYAVKATSASNAWAVGTFGSGSSLDAYIEHFDGSGWTIQGAQSPDPHQNIL